MGRGKGHFCRGHAVHGAVGEVGGVQQERFVLVRADADALAHLPEIHGFVLVAEEGEGYLFGGAGQFGQRRGNGVEVLHRRQRDWYVCHAADLGRPDAGGGDDEVCLDFTLGCLHGSDAPRRQ